MKNRKLNQWLWKWHFIAGIISLPFIILLSITGAIYLFNEDIQKEDVHAIQVIESKNKMLSYQDQLTIANKNSVKNTNSMVFNGKSDLSTEFVLGKFGNKKSIFVNPYNGELKGKYSPKDSWMFSVRKLHGELLGGKVGTKFIELIASWMVVLILTGLYVWWPFSKDIKGVFLVRFNQGKRILFRDLHAVLGFWISILMLITIAGGLPWTDVFGSQFKWVQKVTDTGYPKTWKGIGLHSNDNGKPALELDYFVNKAKDLDLKGVVTIGFPKGKKGTYSISNSTSNLQAQKMLRYDQFSGELIKEHQWSDVGFLMRGRMWLMAFHQGEFGGWNFWLMFSFALFLLFMSLSAVISYFLRKEKGKLGIPKVPKSFNVDKIVVVIILLLGLILPLFGVSLIIIWLFNQFNKKNADT